MGKGRYSGLLVCTDFDGTLAYRGKVSQENLDAIARFQEGGGRLTLATGRYPDVLQTLNVPFSCNAPMVCMNGAILYDAPEKKYLYEGSMKGVCREALLCALQEYSEIRDLTFCFSETRSTQQVAPSDLDTVRRLSDEALYKILIHVSAEQCLPLRDTLRRLGGGKILADRSWSNGVEIQGAEYDKGKTARKLAEYVHADQLICIGDFDNDLSMIQEADRSFAVENATEEIRKAADHIVPAAWENGFAYMIDSL